MLGLSRSESRAHSCGWERVWGWGRGRDICSPKLRGSWVSPKRKRGSCYQREWKWSGCQQAEARERRSGACVGKSQRDVVGAVFKRPVSGSGRGGGRCPRCGVLQPPGGRGRQPSCVPGLRPPTPSQVRFSRPESEQARQRRVQSYEFLQKKHAEEPWVHLHYYGLRVSLVPGAASRSRLEPSHIQW